MKKYAGMIFVIVLFFLSTFGLLAYALMPIGPIDSYELTELYEDGNDIQGELVEIVVKEKGTNIMVGEYLWEERMDVSYVTFNRVNLDWVGVGDTVVVEVNDIVETMGVYMVEIDDVEVLEQ